MLTAHFLNVQHGDSTVLEFDDGVNKHYGVIDSNKVKSQIPALQKLQELGAQRLAFLCITHPDADHYSGMKDILEYYSGRIDKIFTFPVAAALTRKDTIKAWSQRLAADAKIQDDGPTKSKIKELMQILLLLERDNSGIWSDLILGPGGRIFIPQFAGVEFEMLQPPPKSKGPFWESIRKGLYQTEGRVESNGISLATLISYSGKKILMGGDATNDNWIHLKKDRGLNFAADIVKMPHHGSKHDCTPESMECLFQQHGECLAIISANGKKQPDSGTLDWLLSNNIRPLCTNFSVKWASDRRVIPLLDTSDIVPMTSSGIIQNQLEDGRYSSCKGNISITIDGNGIVTLKTQNSIQCPCDPL